MAGMGWERHRVLIDDHIDEVRADLIDLVVHCKDFALFAVICGVTAAIGAEEKQTDSHVKRTTVAALLEIDCEAAEWRLESYCNNSSERQWLHQGGKSGSGKRLSDFDICWS